MRVLIADDTETNGHLLRQILEDENVSCEVVEDGRAAVERATSTLFDVILMDAQMPLLDGLGATRELRMRGVSTPILIVTADPDPAASQRAGADGTLEKPLHSGRLQAELKRFGLEPEPPPHTEESFMREIAHVYLNTEESLVSALIGAIRARDMAAARAASHSLRGALLAVGLEEAAALALAVEMLNAPPEPLFAALRLGRRKLVERYGSS